MGVNYNFSTMKWGCWSKQLEVGFFFINRYFLFLVFREL